MDTSTFSLFCLDSIRG